MKELWDAYDINFNKINNMTLVRGEPLPEDAEDLGDWDVNESAYDPYLGCDAWETESFDDMW